MAELSYAQVSALLKYDSETGKLFWKERTSLLYTDSPGRHSAFSKAARWNARYAGKEAFTALLKEGYRVGSIFDVPHLAHRVAWVLSYKEWPASQIDHENGIRSDNRLANLRLATNTENAKNSKIRDDNTSGTVGVSWMPKEQKWQAYISENGRKINLGRFATQIEAARVRKAAEIRLGYHPNHGRSAKAYPY